MQTVTVYGYDGCHYCESAKIFLGQIGVPFDYFDIKADPANRAAFERDAPDAATVPQILVGGELIGGYDDLNFAFASGRLKALLGE